MAEEKLVFEGREYVGLSFPLGNVPLLIVKAKRGYVACGYISKEAAEKYGDIAAFVSGVKNFDEFFKAKIKSFTSWADDLGIREGMSVKKALELMDQ
ncbi:MAG: DUF1805 domain-containing protein [Candidatus Micrarchaeota archaeon]|nr:DUF1805 domain-containing protein [Candidatus Micrarchaeota archaeon]